MEICQKSREKKEPGERVLHFGEVSDRLDLHWVEREQGCRERGARNRKLSKNLKKKQRRRGVQKNIYDMITQHPPPKEPGFDPKDGVDQRMILMTTGGRLHPDANQPGKRAIRWFGKTNGIVKDRCAMPCRSISNQ